MSRSLNLMPDNYRLRLGDHRIRGRYGVMYVGVLAIAVVLGLTGHARVRDRERELERLDQKVAELDGIVKKTEAVNAQADMLQNDIAESQRLDLPVPVSSVLATVSSLLPEQARLTELRLWVFEQADANATANRRRKLTDPKTQDRNPLAEMRRTLKGEMTGIAGTGVDVSGFFDRLYQHPLFSRVQTDFSRVKTVNNTEVHEFRISFEIDLDVQYRAVASVDPGEFK